MACAYLSFSLYISLCAHSFLFRSFHEHIYVKDDSHIMYTNDIERKKDSSHVDGDNGQF